MNVEEELEDRDPNVEGCKVGMREDGSLIVGELDRLFSARMSSITYETALDKESLKNKLSPQRYHRITLVSHTNA
jgi:hypothetical protein